jgi:hypothetical protein
VKLPETFSDETPLPMVAVAAVLLLINAPFPPEPVPLSVSTSFTFACPFKSTVPPASITVPPVPMVFTIPLLPKALLFPAWSVPLTTVVRPV